MEDLARINPSDATQLNNILLFGYCGSGVSGAVNSISTAVQPPKTTSVLRSASRISTTPGKRCTTLLSRYPLSYYQPTLHTVLWESWGVTKSSVDGNNYESIEMDLLLQGMVPEKFAMPRDPKSLSALMMQAKKPNSANTIHAVGFCVPQEMIMNLDVENLTKVKTLLAQIQNRGRHVILIVTKLDELGFDEITDQNEVADVRKIASGLLSVPVEDIYGMLGYHATKHEKTGKRITGVDANMVEIMRALLTKAQSFREYDPSMIVAAKVRQSTTTSTGNASSASLDKLNQLHKEQKTAEETAAQIEEERLAEEEYRASGGGGLAFGALFSQVQEEESIQIQMEPTREKKEASKVDVKKEESRIEDKVEVKKEELKPAAEVKKIEPAVALEVASEVAKPAAVKEQDKAMKLASSETSATSQKKDAKSAAHSNEVSPASSTGGKKATNDSGVHSTVASPVESIDYKKKDTAPKQANVQITDSKDVAFLKAQLTEWTKKVDAQFVERDRKTDQLQEKDKKLEQQYSLLQQRLSKLEDEYNQVTVDIANLPFKQATSVQTSPVAPIVQQVSTVEIEADIKKLGKELGAFDKKLKDLEILSKEIDQIRELKTKIANVEKDLKDAKQSQKTEHDKIFAIIEELKNKPAQVIVKEIIAERVGTAAPIVVASASVTDAQPSIDPAEIRKLDAQLSAALDDISKLKNLETLPAEMRKLKGNILEIMEQINKQASAESSSTSHPLKEPAPALVDEKLNKEVADLKEANESLKAEFETMKQSLGTTANRWAIQKRRPKKRWSTQPELSNWHPVADVLFLE